MFSLMSYLVINITEQKNKVLNLLVHVQSVINQTQDTIGVNRVTLHISNTPFPHGRREIERLITLFETLKSMHGIIGWY